MKRVLIIVGTRPEAIKVAPIAMAMREGDAPLTPVLCLTGQHPEMAEDALAVFGITPDIRLNCVEPGGDLCQTAASVVRAVGKLIDEQQPGTVLVQGDTLSAYAGGLAAVLRRVPLAHVEAGLRSGCENDPFPEEIARKQLSHLARWNFAPTRQAVRNLRAEGIPADRIVQVGNTVIDALRLVRASVTPSQDLARPLILVTVHRRENWGEPLRRVCRAIRELSRRNVSWRFAFSVHPNPSVGRQVRDELQDCDAVELLDCPRYDAWVERLVRCRLILTDSGGIQEEACALGRPTLVLRQTTERPEAVQAGTALVIGADDRNIVDHTERIMHDQSLYQKMSQPNDMYGDGFASQRIVEALVRDLPTDRSPATPALAGLTAYRTGSRQSAARSHPASRQWTRSK
jgi:UDP-N-acetylglucosamine 2-epimerase